MPRDASKKEMCRARERKVKRPLPYDVRLHVYRLPPAIPSRRPMRESIYEDRMAAGSRPSSLPPEPRCRSCSSRFRQIGM